MTSARKYNCVVLVKQVPDTHNVTSNAMKDDGTMNRAALPAISRKRKMRY
jgi:electron transfer flavoprotein beta subunit